jgi:hypothetical protein
LLLFGKEKGKGEYECPKRKWAHGTGRKRYLNLF